MSSAHESTIKKVQNQGPGKTAVLEVWRLIVFVGAAGHHYSGVLDCLVKTVQSEGVTALWKGWIAQYMR